MHPAPFERGSEIGQACIVDRHRVQGRRQPREVELGTQRTACLLAVPEQSLDLRDRPAELEGGLEPKRAAGVGGRLAPQRVAQGAAECLAAVDRLLVEETAACECVVPEDPLAEGVNRGDGPTVESAYGSREAATQDIVDHPVVRPARGFRRNLFAAARDHVLELGAHARADLLGGFLRERDDQQLLERHIGPQKELDDEVFEREGLSRPRRRFDDGVAIERNLAKHSRPRDPDPHEPVPQRSSGRPKRLATISCARFSSGAS